MAGSLGRLLRQVPLLSAHESPFLPRRPEWRMGTQVGLRSFGGNHSPDTLLSSESPPASPNPRGAACGRVAAAEPPCDGGRLVPRGSAQGQSPVVQSLSANTQITPPWGTSVLVPRNVSSRACMRWASTPQPDCTATY